MARMIFAFLIVACCIHLPAKHPPLGLTSRATVKRVIDGDTIEVVVTWPVRIRMKDCWAPEMRGEERPKGIISKAHLESLIPEGSPVVFHVASSEATSLGDLLTFGRVVANVWRKGDATSLSQIMVDDGLASETKQ